MKVRFAVSPGLGPPEPDRLAEMADAAEDLGFDAIWLSDLPTLPGIDPFLAAAYVASRTTRLKIGTNLVPFGYEPFVFARQLAQLDRLAAGRLLVTLVPGLDAPGERAALGIAGAHRGRLLDERIPILRDLLAGGDVPGGDDGPVALPVLPVQQPLELWLGGSGPQAVARAGRLADGWLGSLMPPTRAAAIRGGIADAAAAAGRTVDPEHFGLSIAYARHADPATGAVPLTARAARARIEPAEPIPVGRDALRSLVARLVDVGMSKFVVRPATTVTGWRDELAWLADAVLDLQT